MFYCVRDIFRMHTHILITKLMKIPLPRYHFSLFSCIMHSFLMKFKSDTASRPLFLMAGCPTPYSFIVIIFSCLCSSMMKHCRESIIHILSYSNLSKHGSNIVCPSSSLADCLPTYYSSFNASDKHSPSLCPSLPYYVSE